MADLSPAASAPGLTKPERAILHALGFCAVSRLYDDRIDLVVDHLRANLPRMARRPQTARILDAAEAVSSAFARRNQPAGGPAWACAMLDADRAVQEFHWAGFCALSEAQHG